MGSKFRVGDRIVVLHQKYANQPPAEAKQIVADRNGERYQYSLEKSVTIRRLLAEDRVEIEDHEGIREVIDSHDPRLRHAGMAERFLLTLLRWKSLRTPADS
ncbi:MAG: hypothetical protein AB8B50_16495 [Pirellulaceae bacterium]